MGRAKANTPARKVYEVNRRVRRKEKQFKNNINSSLLPLSMTSILWTEIYCPICEKVTKHRHTCKEDSPSIIQKIMSSPETEWECWACRTAKRKSVRTKEGALLTMYVKKDRTQQEAEKDPNRAAIECLAIALSQIEERLIRFEKMFSIKSKNRAIKIEYK